MADAIDHADPLFGGVGYGLFAVASLLVAQSGWAVLVRGKKYDVNGNHDNHGTRIPGELSIAPRTPKSPHRLISPARSLVRGSLPYRPARMRRRSPPPSPPPLARQGSLARVSLARASLWLVARRGGAHAPTLNPHGPTQPPTDPPHRFAVVMSGKVVVVTGANCG